MRETAEDEDLFVPEILIFRMHGSHSHGYEPTYAGVTTVGCGGQPGPTGKEKSDSRASRNSRLSTTISWE